MKPTSAQLKALKDYLRKALNYRETYAEFYDHILAALESKHGNMSFEDAVNSIIGEDFGGIERMRSIEKSYQKETMKEMQKKYLTYVIECLKFPLISIFAVCSIIVYYLIKQPWFNLFIFLGVLFILRIIPRLLKSIRYFITGYVFYDTKRSVKDSIFVWLDYIPGILFCFFMVLVPIFHKVSSMAWLKNMNSAVMTALFILYALHTFVFYKVYKEDIKTIVTVN